MSTREGNSEQPKQEYLSKKVVINGQTVTLYSLNGHTWLSTPDQLADVMARLDNTRVLLNDGKTDGKDGKTDGKAEAKGDGKTAGSPMSPKPTAARYRMRGPKPRPILQPDGSLAPVVEREPVSATDTEVRMGGAGLDLVRPGSSQEPPIDPKSYLQSTASKKPATKQQKLVAPIAAPITPKLRGDAAKKAAAAAASAATPTATPAAASAKATPATREGKVAGQKQRTKPTLKVAAKGKTASAAAAKKKEVSSKRPVAGKKKGKK